MKCRQMGQQVELGLAADGSATESETYPKSWDFTIFFQTCPVDGGWVSVRI